MGAGCDTAENRVLLRQMERHCAGGAVGSPASSQRAKR
jgi:hypothetical protein